MKRIAFMAGCVACLSTCSGSTSSDGAADAPGERQRVDVVPGSCAPGNCEIVGSYCGSGSSCCVCGTYSGCGGPIWACLTNQGCPAKQPMENESCPGENIICTYCDGPLAILRCDVTEAGYRWHGLANVPYGCR